MAEAAFQLRETPHWQALLDSTGEGIWGINLEGLCTFINRMALETFGLTSGEVLGKNIHELVHHHYPDGRVFPVEECPLYRSFRRNVPHGRMRDTMFRRDGSPFSAEVSAQPVRIADEVVGGVVTFRDVSEAVERETEMRHAYELAERHKAELDAVIESIPHGVYVAPVDGSSIRLNRRAIAMSGTFFPTQLKTLDHALAGESTTEVVQAEGRWLHSVGAPIQLNGELIGGVAVNTDVTQSRLQDAALRKSEKLAAVGQLASSIAHEINNPLESITNLLYLIGHSGSLDEVQEYAGMAQTELARVTEITMQTLRFHRTASRAVEVDLEDLARSVASLYTGRLLVRNIQLQWKMLPAPRVFCLEGEIRQVLNNLIRNGLDAMTSGGAMSLRLHAQRCRRTGRHGVRLTVADAGEGIDPRIQPRLFEPFQTTKETSGTGLGLWVSKGIVAKHGGHLRVRTRREAVGHGTIFTVWLPVKDDVNRTSQAVH